MLTDVKMTPVVVKVVYVVGDVLDVGSVSCIVTVVAWGLPDRVEEAVATAEDTEDPPFDATAAASTVKIMSMARDFIQLCERDRTTNVNDIGHRLCRIFCIAYRSCAIANCITKIGITAETEDIASRAATKSTSDSIGIGYACVLSITHQLTQCEHTGMDLLLTTQDG